MLSFFFFFFRTVKFHSSRHKLLEEPFDPMKLDCILPI